MSARTERIDTDDGVALDALNEVRLSRNWSYAELADDMERVGHGLPVKTLYQLLADRPENPYDRTIYQVRRYLEVVQREKRRTA